MKIMTAQFVYEITCPRCQYTWSATKEETFDLDIVSCSQCGSCELEITKKLEA